MSEQAKVTVHDPYPNEVWHQTAAYRWAVPDDTTTKPPVLQLAWRSSYGRTRWRKLETVVVSAHEYEA